MKSSWLVQGEKVHASGDNPFDNRFYGYRETDLVLPDGQPAKYHGVLIGACVHVVAIDSDLTTYLVRQSRPNARALGSKEVPTTLELPGGFVDPALDIETAANCELRDEVGKRAGSLERVGVLYPSPGISNETDTIFLGTELSDEQRVGYEEPTEQDIRIVAEPFGRVYDRIVSGQEPVAAQTLAALAMVAARL